MNTRNFTIASIIGTEKMWELCTYDMIYAIGGWPPEKYFNVIDNQITQNILFDLRDIICFTTFIDNRIKFIFNDDAFTYELVEYLEKCKNGTCGLSMSLEEAIIRDWTIHQCTARLIGKRYDELHFSKTDWNNFPNQLKDAIITRAKIVYVAVK